MPRTNRKSELLGSLSQFAIFRDTTPAVTTTLSSAVASAAVNLPMTAVTGFNSGDYMRVDSGEAVEILKIQGTPAVSCPLREPVGQAHESGVSVFKQTLTDLGHIADDGFRFNNSGDDNPVYSATRRLAVGYLPGNLEMIFDVTLEGFNLENIATSLGMPESTVTGAGSLASPHSLFTNGSNMRTENDLSFAAFGARKDGKIVYMWLMGVEIDMTAFATAISRGNASTIPIRGRVTSGIRWGIHEAV